MKILDFFISMNEMRICLVLRFVSLFLSKSLGVKKPAGTAEDIERHFGCESSRLVMVDEMELTCMFFYVLFSSFLVCLTIEVVPRAGR